MENRRKDCRKVRMWLILNKGKLIPLWMSKHIESCSLCREFARDEGLIYQFSKLSNDSIPTKGDNLDIRVKKAIFEVSEKLSQKNKRRFINPVFSPKIGIIIASFAILLAVFYLPIYRGENYFGYSFNRKFENLIASFDPSISLLKPTYGNCESDNINSLKFMNAFFDNEPYKSFYYTHRDALMSELLTVKLFSSLSNKDPSIVYSFLRSGDYAKVCRDLGLSYKDATEKLKEFIEGSSYLNTDVISIEGIVTSVDYISGKMYIDSLYEPIRLDFLTFSEIYPGNYVLIKASKEVDTFFALSISPAEFKSTIIKGTLLEANDKCIRLSTFSKPIYINNETIIKDKEEKVSLNSILRRNISLRAIIKNGEAYALSILTINEGEERILSGKLLQVYKYGFTFRNVKLSFYYSASVKFLGVNGPALLKKGAVVTVKGIDYGNMFEVKEIVYLNNTNSVIKKPVYIALASSPSYSFKANKRESELVTYIDYVVGINDNKTLFLKSGKTLKLTSEEIPSGAKIKVVLNKSDNSILSINLIDFGKIKKLSSFITSYEVINSNVIALKVNQKTLFFYLDDAYTFSSSGIIQAKYFDYGDFGIVERMRFFNYSEVVDIRGYITEAIEDGKKYLLDNGYILSIDELSSLEGGSLLVGRTVNVIGVLDKGCITGYIVKVNEEYGIISGTIIEINFSLNYIKLDSGMIIKLDSNTIYAISKESLSIGDQIVSKVLLINNEYVAKEIYLASEYTGKVG